MAYVSNVLTQSSTAGAAAYVVTLPPHVADDILVVCVSADGGGTLTATWGGTFSGAAQVGATQVSTTNLSAAVFYAKSTGTAATLTINMGTLDAIHVHMAVLKDVDTTTFFDVGDADVLATLTEVTTTSITTTTADCLVLHYLATDQNVAAVPIMAHSRPGPSATMHFLDSSDNGGATTTTAAGGALGWYYQRTAGATPTPVWDLSATAITAKFAMAFRNKASGTIPPYVDDSASLGTQLMTGSWWASATTRNNQNFKATPLTLGNIGPNGAGLATVFDSGTAVVDAGLNPYSNAVNSTPSSTGTANGFELGFPTTAIDMTTGWIVGAFQASTSKMALFTQGSIAQGGTYLALASTTNYRSYNIMARDNRDGTGAGFAIFSVQANQTQTMFGNSATPPTITAIDKILILHKGQNAVGSFYYMDFHLIKKLILAGGDSVTPVDSVGVFDIGKFCRIPLVAKGGAAGLVAYVPVQVGGGDAINFQIDAGALQFPRIHSLDAKEINYHGADNAIGISYAGKSGDVIKHTNSVVTSKSPYYWEIHSAATNAATWDFAGLVVVNANVTLRNVVTFAGMSFSSCKTLVFSSCTVSSCKISGVPSTNDTLTTDATTAITGCTINVTGVAAAGYWCSVASPSIFSGCAFTGSGSTGHAIRITTAGTYTFNGNTFTGFGAIGTNFAAIFNDSGGLVTLNITGGGGTPTYRNGAGATTTVNNNVTVTLTGLRDLTEIRVYTSGTTTEVAGIEDATAGSADARMFAFALAGGSVVDIRIHNKTYEALSILTYTIPTSDASLPISQRFDRNYSNP